MPDTYHPRSFQTEADAPGELTLGGIDGDRIEIELGWKEPVAQQKLWADIEMLLREFSSAMGGKGHSAPGLVITNPLGRRPIGGTHEEGVVDEFGRVFDTGKPAARAKQCSSISTPRQTCTSKTR